MSEMKMSDVFKLPLSIDKDIKHYVYDSNGKYITEFNTIRKSKCFVSAINTHDSLVEEVERLRGERDELIYLLDQFVKFDSNEVTYTSLRAAMADSINLLAKIKGEDK